MRTLALILALIGLPALFGIIRFVQSPGVDIAPSLQKLDPQVTHVLISTLGLCYALSALGSAYAAWTDRPWLRPIYLVFVTSAALFFALFLHIAPIPRDAFSFIVGPVSLGLVALGLWKGWQVIGAAATK